MSEGSCYWHLPNGLAEVTMKSETLTILNKARSGGPGRWQGGHHIDRLTSQPGLETTAMVGRAANVDHDRGEASGGTNAVTFAELLSLRCEKPSRWQATR